MAGGTLSEGDSHRLRVGPHGTGSIEFKMEHRLPETGSATFDFKAHLVFPTSLGITEELLDRGRFYANRRSYLRLHPPQEPLKKLAKEKLQVGKGDALVRRQHRLFAQRLRHSMAAQIRATRQLLQQGELTQARELFQLLVTNLEDARQQLAAVQSELPAGRLREVSRACDEWISLEMTARLLQLAYRFQKRNVPPPEDLWTFLQHEAVWRNQQSYPSAPLHPERHGEALLTRMSRLKKVASSVLYLDLENRGPSSGARDLLLAVAASVAMLWAVGMQFVAWWIGGNPFEAGASSFTVTTFVVVAVFAYAMKDKIKEGLRSWFRAKLPVWLYDREQIGFDDEGDAVARSRESLEYHQLEELPLTIQRWYEDSGTLDVPVHFLSYSRRTEVNAGRLRQGRPDMGGLTEIIRMSVRPWLTHMDGPYEPLWLPREQQVEKHEAKRLYPVLLMLEMEDGDGGGRLRLTRRLELSREGVEKVRREIQGDFLTELPDRSSDTLQPVQAGDLLPFDPDEEDPNELD